MLTNEECRELELKTLGTELDDVIHSDVIREHTAGYCSNVAAFRKMRGADNEERYENHLISLFSKTKDKFDWAERTAYTSKLKSGKELVIVDEIDPPLKDDGRPVESRLDQHRKRSRSLEDALSENFMTVCKELNSLQLAKGRTYKDSWRKRGEVGVFHNMARKWDRIENIVEYVSRGNTFVDNKLPEGEESLRETLVDLAVYTIKMITLYDELHPGKK